MQPKPKAKPDIVEMSRRCITIKLIKLDEYQCIVINKYQDYFPVFLFKYDKNYTSALIGQLENFYYLTLFCAR